MFLDHSGLEGANKSTHQGWTLADVKRTQKLDFAALKNWNKSQRSRRIQFWSAPTKMLNSATIHM